MRTQWEDGLWTKKQELTRHQICWCLDLELLSLHNCEKHMFVVWVTSPLQPKQTKTPWANRDGDWSAAAGSQGIPPSIPSSYWKLGRAKNTPCLKPLEGAWVYPHLDFGSLDTRTGREYISVVLSHQVCVLCHGSHPGLPHCRWILYWLSHQGSPKCLCPPKIHLL